VIAKFVGQCIKCGGAIPKGADVAYDSAARKIYHHDCGAASSESEPSRGDHTKLTSEALAERLGFVSH
jgi:hypothetical protein